MAMSIDERLRVVRAFFESARKSNRLVTASGLLSELGMEANDLKEPKIYNFIKDRLILQGVRLPKHAHESVMADFVQVFGGMAESSVCIIKSVQNVSIGLEQFRSETDSMDKEDIRVDSDGLENVK